MIISVLRKEARQNLKGKWKKALLIMLLFYLITILIGCTVNWVSLNTPYGLFASILNMIISVALNYGILVSFIKIKRNEEVKSLHFIYYAGRDVEKVWRVTGRILFKLSGYIILLILFLYLMITELVSLYYGYGMRLSYIVEILGVIIFSVLLTMKTLYYSLSNNILYDNRDNKTKEILKESERLMKGHRWDFVKMNLSFIGWLLLAIIFSIVIILALYFGANIRNSYLLYITYIPLIFLLPYTYTTTVCFYDNLLYNNPKEDEISNKPKKKNKRNTNKNK